MLGSRCVSLGVCVCVRGGMIVLPDRDDLISEQQAQRMSPRMERVSFFSFSECRIFFFFMLHRKRVGHMF